MVLRLGNGENGTLSVESKGMRAWFFYKSRIYNLISAIWIHFFAKCHTPPNILLFRNWNSFKLEKNLGYANWNVVGVINYSYLAIDRFRDSS